MNVVTVVPGDALWNTYLDIYTCYLLENFPDDFGNTTAKELVYDVASMLNKRYDEGGRGLFLLYASQQIVGMSNAWFGYEKIIVLNIAEFYIRPSYQQQGLGRFKYQYLLDWGKQHGAQAIRLETDLLNEAANGFWSAMGLHVQSVDGFRVYYEADLSEN